MRTFWHLGSLFREMNHRQSTLRSTMGYAVHTARFFRRVLCFWSLGTLLHVPVYPVLDFSN